MKKWKIVARLFWFSLVLASVNPVVSAQQESSNPVVGSSSFTNSAQRTNREAVVRIDDQTQTIYKLPDFFTYTFTAITILVSIVTVVLGALLAFNFFAARDVVKKAESELQKLVEIRAKYDSEVGGLKASFEEHMNTKTAEFLNKASSMVQNTIDNHYAAVVIRKTKQELMEVLMSQNPCPKMVFAKLTDILEFPDDLSLKIYLLCLEKCSANQDITKKVNQGLSICALRLGNQVFAPTSNSHPLPSALQPSGT